MTVSGCCSLNSRTVPGLIVTRLALFETRGDRADRGAFGGAFATVGNRADRGASSRAPRRFTAGFSTGLGVAAGDYRDQGRAHSHLAEPQVQAALAGIAPGLLSALHPAITLVPALATTLPFTARSDSSVVVNRLPCGSLEDIGSTVRTRRAVPALTVTLAEAAAAGAGAAAADGVAGGGPPR